MKFTDYQKAVDQITYGKRLPGSLYVYRDPDSDFGFELNRFLGQIISVHQIGTEFNVLKFRTDEFKISFLSYPSFFEDPHPALHKAISIDLANGKARHADYTGNLNPPILHRKESFVPQSHRDWHRFDALTKAEEQAGLYEDITTIGFKLNWERLLNEKGIISNGHSIEKRPEVSSLKLGPAPVVERYKTAMARYELSKPVKTLLEYGLLKTGMTFFDYGCGQGSDVRGLQGLGYKAEGWDPVFQPSAGKLRADIVNLGYVLNVIEDPAERLEALVDAHRFASRLLVVSALIRETVETSRSTTFRDGFLTNRNTFQKFFDQHELQQYIEDALETTAVPAGLGIFYVFRNATEQQDFLSARSQRTIDWSQISARLGLGEPHRSLWKTLYQQHTELIENFGNCALRLGRLPGPGEFDREQEVAASLGSGKRALRAFVLGSGRGGLDWPQIAAQFGFGQPPKPRWQALYESHQDLLDAFWQNTLQIGRLPVPDEFPQFAEIVEKIGSAKKALQIFLKRGGGEALKKARDTRRNDLLVYVSLANLRKRVPFGDLSGHLRRDIKEFFGNYRKALGKGLELLYAAGDPGEIELACENLVAGWQDEQALYIHRTLLADLPPLLRVYVGCATALFGAADQADVIKIHKMSGKVTFLIYDNFEEKPLPELRHRIKVNLRTRWVNVFDHSAEGQLLYFKERFVSPQHPNRAAMEKFSAKVRKLDIPDSSVGPAKLELMDLLQRHGLNENLNPRRKRLSLEGTDRTCNIAPRDLRGQVAPG